MSAMRDAILLTLQADASVIALVGSAVYPNMPPEGATFPLITVTAKDAPTPERVFRGDGAATDEIAFERATYLVRACVQSTSPALADDINAAIRTALDGIVLTITDATNLNCQYVGSYESHEVYESQIYQYAGGFYEIWAK